MPDNRHVVLSASVRARRLDNSIWRTPSSSALTVILQRHHGAELRRRSRRTAASWRFWRPRADRDVVSVDLATAAVTPVIATQRSEQMPAWAVRESAMVYVTDRNGADGDLAAEAWPAGPPARDAARFSAGQDARVHGARAVPRRHSRHLRPARRGKRSRGLWMSAVAGGPPVPLVKSAGERHIQAPGHRTGTGSSTGTWKMAGSP